MKALRAGGAIAAAAALFFLAQMGAAPTKADGGARELVKGTGNFLTQTTRTSVPLDPSCVNLVTRAGTAEFSGVITNALANGQFESRTLQDACMDPVQGTFLYHIRLEDATVAGRTGGLDIEVEGVFEGDVASPEGARTRGHGTIRGVSGKLKGARGNFQFVGRRTITDQFSAYYAEIQLR